MRERILRTINFLRLLANFRRNGEHWCDVCSGSDRTMCVRREGGVDNVYLQDCCRCRERREKMAPW